MSSQFPGRPPLLKGALVAFESQSLGSLPSVVVFQYNPDQLSRTLSPRTPPAGREGSAGAAREDALRVQGPPVETISLTVEMDAADQLADAAANPQVLAFGLHPQLAALELLLYPPTAQLLQGELKAALGEEERVRPRVPFLLFVYGPARVAPVQLTNFSVTEEAHDQLLNPIRARVELQMRVMTTAELERGTLAHGAYLAYQTRREVLSRASLVGNAVGAVGKIVTSATGP